MTKANEEQIGGDHYKCNENITQQHWDYAWEHGFDQFQYCITKYVERWKKKNGIEDLYKARHHLQKYIELEEKRIAEEGNPESKGYVNQDHDSQ